MTVQRKKSRVNFSLTNCYLLRYADLRETQVSMVRERGINDTYNGFTFKVSLDSWIWKYPTLGNDQSWVYSLKIN